MAYRWWLCKLARCGVGGIFCGKKSVFLLCSIYKELAVNGVI